MKYFLTIFLSLLFGATFAQRRAIDWPDSTVSHPSGSEYFSVSYNATSHQAYYYLNDAPAICTGQPTYVTEVWGGPHDAGATGRGGTLYVTGSNVNGELGNGNTTGTCGGCLIQITTDSAGNALPPVTQLFFSGVLASGENWTSAIVTDDTVSRQVGVAGYLGYGMRGNGTTGATVNTKFVWVTFPVGTHIVKITGEYGYFALDAKGNVWSWSFGGNATMLMRSGSYTTPGMVTLPNGRHAIDVASIGIATVIVLDDGELLGGGTYPTYWGGLSATSSTSPQNFTTFAYSQITGGGTARDTVKKVDCNNSSLYYITYDSTLWSSGDNACGTIGNGQQMNWAAYKCCPAPNQGSAAPYAYDNGPGELVYSGIYHVAPGTHNWVTTYGSKSNAWFIHAINGLGQTFGWGRNKSNQQMNTFVTCAYYDGGLNGSRPDYLEVPWPVQIPNLFSTTLVQVNCPECFTNPTFDNNCSQCSQTQGAAPTVSAGSTQNLSGGTTASTLTASFTGANGAAYQYGVWTQVSGPNTAIISFPGMRSTPISGLTGGQYHFSWAGTDQLQVSATASVIVNVGAPSPPSATATATTINVPYPQVTDTLVGTATPSGGTTISSVTWTQIVGPNTATIATPSSLTTQISGLIPGNYSFQIVATQSDAQVSPPATVSIQVGAAPSTGNYTIRKRGFVPYIR